jgi:hypothetical protein
LRIWGHFWERDGNILSIIEWFFIIMPKVIKCLFDTRFPQKKKKKSKLVNKISNSKVQCKFAKEKECYFYPIRILKNSSIKLVLIAIYYFHVGLWRCSNAKI